MLHTLRIGREGRNGHGHEHILLIVGLDIGTRVWWTRVPHKVLEFFKLGYQSASFLKNRQIGTRVLWTQVPHKVLEFFKLEYLVPTFLTPTTELMHNEWCTLTTTLTSFQLHL